MLLTDGPPAGRTYDCVVIGSGPAGISLALSLGDANKRVLLLESGDAGRARPELSNSVGYGHFSGEFWNLHSSRALGGTSDVWGGWCPALRELDLDNPALGARWPITRGDLLPYYPKAAAILDHDPRFSDFETPLFEGFVYRPVPVAAPTRFGVKYLEALTSSRSVDVATNCSVIRLTANASRSTVTGLEFVHHGPDTTRQLALTPAQSLVLAAGGIGNARLLLEPPADGGVPVGNESGNAGRYLMEHPHFDRAGECAVDVAVDRLWPSANRGHGVHAVIADDDLSRQHGLFACSLQWARKNAEHEMARHLSAENGRGFFHYVITARSEMLPSPNNRVFLTGERDRFGMHRPGARCIVDARDYMNVELTLRLLGEALIRLGKGRVRVNNDRIYLGVAGGGHIMGTTRMGDSSGSSVVDRDCRAHGYENLFVAGSSVFPSGGSANPTLTIVALALRLAERLAAR